MQIVSPAALAERQNALPVNRKTNKKAWLSVAVCAAVLLFGGFFLRQKWSSDSSFEKIELKALTTSGDIVESAVAPDGKLLAYVKSERGKQSLWIKQIPLRTSEMRLTEPNAELTTFNDDSLPFINNFAVSADGSQLALTRGRKISDVVLIENFK